MPMFRQWVLSAQERINVYFNEATGGRYVPRAVLMDLEPGLENAHSLRGRLEVCRKDVTSL